MGQDSDMLALKERVKIGNEKLIAAWPRIWDIKDKEERERELERWDKANRRLDSLCMELMHRFNYRDCVYLQNGRKTKPCVRPDGFCCFVCPSETPYWRKETEATEVQKTLEGFQSPKH